MNDNSRLDNRSYLMHYGTPRHSGRYPWGSGQDPYQHGSADFIGRVEKFRKEGLSESEIKKALGVTSAEYKTLHLIAENERNEDTDFISKINAEKAKGSKTDKDIYDAFGMSSTKYRALRGNASNKRKMQEYEIANALKDQGKSATEIGKIMNKSESTVRGILDNSSPEERNQTIKVANYIRNRVDTKGVVDVGAGIEREAEIGISETRMKQALEILKEEGYVVESIGLPQPTNPGQQTPTKLIGPPGTQYKDFYAKMKTGEISGIRDYISDESNKEFIKEAVRSPESISSSRVKIRYGDEGGEAKDGLIEIRPGVKDLSLGNSKYAQVRIAVDGTHYLKGMAIYSNDIPEGSDIVFNTNKKSNKTKMEVLKPLSDDPDNPFGAVLTSEGQSEYDGDDGKKHLSAINKLHPEGDWGKYDNGLSSQFLAKQPRQLIKKQLDLTYADKEQEYDEICKLNNPTIKKHFLKEFANSCDSSAVHLKAAALPRSAYQVLLPVPEMKDDEVYAPGYRNGEKVALIRYPHGGIFEIPILTVNNKQPNAVKAIGKSLDAVGINKTVADKLSGADFDGDDVLVIPTGRNVKIQSKETLDGLVNFDSKQYSADEVKTDSEGKEHYYRNGKEYKIMTEKYKQTQMGVVSNLITDMTLRGANYDEIEKAVKHSMVVIDAVKHKLDYTQSAKDNDIRELAKKYQLHTDRNGNLKENGASTLISRSNSRIDVPKRRGAARVNQPGKKWYDPSKPEGSLIWQETGRTYVDKKGNTVTETQKSKQMMETDDAKTLAIGHPVELLYADYANKMKAMANEARKEEYTTPDLKYSRSAKDIYAPEVSSLMAKLNVAMLNAPRERQAQVIANSVAEAKAAEHPELKSNKKEFMKVKTQAMAKARVAVGSSSASRKIKITDKEWEAIQAGAISHTKLSSILMKTDVDELRERATPRSSASLSAAQKGKVAAMRASGYTLSQIADVMHVSTSTISKLLQ